MMKVQVEIRKLVKPCKPTPPHLRTYKISMIDELNPSVHHIRILHYPPPSDPVDQNQTIINALEHSLARVLPLFYPLAGRYITGSHTVDCDDQGALFSVCHVDSHLLPLIGAEAELLNSLLPIDICHVDGPTDPMLAVQINRFTCGGLAVALCASQRILDSCSVAIFLKSWADSSFRNTEPEIRPDFDSASFFPSSNLEPLNFGLSRTRDKSVVCRRLVFNRNAISKLRERASSSPLLRQPSRVVVVSAVLTQAILRSDRAKLGKPRASLIAQAVNVRERTVPPISRHACGTWASLSYVANTAEQSLALETDFQGMVMKMREATMKGIEDCKRILSDRDFGRWVLVDSYLDGAKKAESSNYRVVWITDWSKFGDYELDFGFGKPVWVSLADIPLHDTIVLMNTRENDGIEAWVYLHESDMPFLEQDEDITSLIADDDVSKNVAKRHAIVFPYPYNQGNVAPMVNLALNLVSKGFRVTYVRLGNGMLAETFGTGVDVRCVTVSDGSSLDFPNRVDELVGRIVSESSDDTFFVVADSMYTWPATIAMKHKLVNVSFSAESALDLLRENESITVKALEQVKNADFVLCNTVQELETEALSVLNQNKPIYAIGPVVNSFNFSAPEPDCADWLRSKPPGSVLYVSLGRVSQDEMKEIAHGLVLSQVPFVWADFADNDVFPVGFKDVVKERGFVVNNNTWVDNNAILADVAVGGFLTHCGWNSILESVWNGVPMICYPCFGDRRANGEVVGDEWKIGVSFCGDGRGVIDREEVASKIDVLMKGKTCVELREEVKKVSKIVRNAVDSDHGSSRRNFDQFVHQLKSRLDASQKLEGGSKN